MRWPGSFLLLLLLLSAATSAAQITGAPPFFNGLNVLRNTAFLQNNVKKMVAGTDRGRRLLSILHLGDSHVKSGYFAEAFADSLNRYFVSLPDGDNVALTVMAKNGATSKHFLKEPYDSARVQALQPDVVIISLGTNEAQNLYSQTDLQTYFTTLLAQIKKDAPQSAIVFTTPGDALRKTTRQVKKRKRWYTVTSLQPNVVLPTVVNFIKEFAVSNNAAYWDWNAVMGGRGAVARWVGHGYANTDRVHLLEKGYNLQGWLLATAFINYIKSIASPL